MEFISLDLFFQNRTCSISCRWFWSLFYFNFLILMILFSFILHQLHIKPKFFIMLIVVQAISSILEPSCTSGPIQMEPWETNEVRKGFLLVFVFLSKLIGILITLAAKQVLVLGTSLYYNVLLCNRKQKLYMNSEEQLIWLWSSWITGATYRLRISNVGLKTSLNFRIQDHLMLLVEAEGSYTAQQTYSNLDIHVGQSYSVLVTAKNQTSGKSYYMVASSRLTDAELFGVGVIRYPNSDDFPSGPLPPGPQLHDYFYSIEQARSIRYASLIPSKTRKTYG